MSSLLVFMLLQEAQDASRFEDPAREVQWARSFVQAYREAGRRNVPVFVYLASDS